MRTISIDEARKQLFEILDEISDSREPVTIESEGERLAVLLDPRDYDRFKRVFDDAIARAWETIERIREQNADTDPDEIYRIVTEEVEAVRQERYEKSKAAASSRDR